MSKNIITKRSGFARKELCLVLVLLPAAGFTAIWWGHRDDQALARLWAKPEIMQPIAERIARYCIETSGSRPEKEVFSGEALLPWIPELVDAGLPESLHSTGSLVFLEDEATLSFERRGLLQFDLVLHLWWAEWTGSKGESERKVWRAEASGMAAPMTFSIAVDPEDGTVESVQAKDE